MKVLTYPADLYGCGHHRIIWPAEVLTRDGHAVTIIRPGDRKVRMTIDDRRDQVVDVNLPEGTDVVVYQRVTHRYHAQTVSVIRGKGIAVVVDVDDDLSTIHPDNAAFTALHPSHEGAWVGGVRVLHSWRYLAKACADATLVTATTPALLRRYAVHGRGVLLPNFLAGHYYGHEHVDSDVIGWPASLHSHPNDPAALGNAVSRLLDDGARVRVTAKTQGVGPAFGRAADDEIEYLEDEVSLLDWPRVLAERIGIGIVPLADTIFNRSKSWLKIAELCAAGVPWVASPRTEYRRLHEMGAGLLAEKPKQWYGALQRLRRNPVLRAELSAAGREVAEQLRLTRHAHRWWEAWELGRQIEDGGGTISSDHYEATSVS